VKAFFDAIRHQFGGKMTQAQVEGCEALIRATDGLPLAWRAYLLATAFHETGQAMQPIKETVMPHHKDKNPSDATVIKRLDTAFAAGKLRSVKTPYWRDGWFGRGYVQITHRDGYDRAGKALGLDLIADPDLALVPEYAAKILVRGCTEGWFTGKKLGDYASYKEMRRVVNGTDRADDIARYARAFEGAFVALGDGITDRPITPPQKPASAPVAPAVPSAPATPTGLVAAIIAALAAIGAYLAQYM
jgi:hypothetical protein